MYKKQAGISGTDIPAVSANSVSARALWTNDFIRLRSLYADNSVSILTFFKRCLTWYVRSFLSWASWIHFSIVESRMTVCFSSEQFCPIQMLYRNQVNSCRPWIIYILCIRSRKQIYPTWSRIPPCQRIRCKIWLPVFTLSITG